MAEKVIVKVNEGKVRGIKNKSSFSGVEYYSFFGIPYGQTTSGSLRYKDPVKVKPWNTILDATIEKNQGCVQFSFILNDTCGSEDCLYSNIHTPKLPSKDDPLKAVIFLIHPGGAIHGSPETWHYGSPDNIMHHDIVYVGIAYRLHHLGFLNLGLDECSGNQGLKDILLGLEWVRDNIVTFGGDPNNVTLLGSSSGAVLVHSLMISPRAQGLFHKAVMMGGYFYNPLRLTKEENMSVAAELAEDLNYVVPDKQNGKKLHSIYRKISPEQLALSKPDKKLNTVLGTPFPVCPFWVTLDHGENSVLPVDFRKAIPSTARVPILYGISEKEAVAAFTQGMRAATKKHFLASMRLNCSGWGKDLTDDELRYIRKKLEAFYWKGNPIETAPISLQVDVLTDLGNSDVYDTMINVIAEDIPNVYVYKFTFEGNAVTMKEVANTLLEENVPGSFHASDFSYWTPISYFSKTPHRNFSKETTQMIHTFTKIVTQFAKTGDPNNENLKVHWTPSTVDKPCYMKIDSEMQLIDGKLNGERHEFWENLKNELRPNY